MEFISSDILINRILDGPLRSFKNTGRIDDGRIYGWIQKETALLNLSGYNPIKLITKLDGKTLLKPENYSHLWAIWKVHPHTVQTHNRKYFQNQHTYYKEELCTDVVVNQCMEILSEGQFITTRYYIETPEVIHEDVYNISAPLKIFQKPGMACNYSEEFKHLSSPYQVMESSDKFEFNFEDEFVYLEYFGNLLDEDGYPMVPKSPVLEKAIEDYIVWQFFQEEYYNNYSDALQRMQAAEIAYIKSHNIATSLKKTPEFSQLYNYFSSKYKRIADKEFNYSRRVRQ